MIGAIGLRLVGAIQYFVAELSLWIWPILEDLHFLGLALLVGATGLLNLRVLGWSAVLAVATGLLVAILPALQATRTDPHESLKSDGRAGDARLVHRRRERR